MADEQWPTDQVSPTGGSDPEMRHGLWEIVRALNRMILAQQGPAGPQGTPGTPGGQGPVGPVGPSGVTIDAFEFVFENNGSALATDQEIILVSPYNGTITQATLVGDQSGSLIVDVYKCTYSQYDAGATHPVAGDKITSTTPPTIASTVKAKDTTLTNWTKAVAIDDLLIARINSATTITRATLALTISLSP